MFRIFFFLFVALVIARDASARVPPPARTVFALIVTSNRGVSGSRPDLRYADDDGVKYLELFRMLAPDANIVLHTELDRDTERLYPWARAAVRPPTKAAVSASISDLAQRIRGVTQVGGEVELYFVFAGHGDVDAGVGFLELRDARFTSPDIEAMLRTTAATRSHVILDSCNSFFVLNARKPGGRPVATTADEARSLSERLPSVGVFLSTSSEAEVFEWSELQAGIFSHTVRSGLTGAADANGDGNVSYEELRSFVGVASARIKNPLYRPKVFARGPRGDAAAPLVSFSSAHATTLHIDGARIRLTLRDADEVPLIDLHKEDGAAITLRLPDRWATRAAAEERDAEVPSHVLKRFVLEAPRTEPPMALAELTLQPPPGEMRGAGDVFRMLFAVPFGPKAMAQAAPEVRKEDASAVYGVSEDDVERMRVLLEQAAGDARGRRLTIGTGYVAFGAVLGSAGAWLLTRDDDSAKKAAPFELIGYGGLLAGMGTWSLLRTSGEELLFKGYSQAIESTDPARRAKALARAENVLFCLRDSAHKTRIWQRVSSFVLIGLSTLLFVGNEVAATKRDETCGLGVCTSRPDLSSDTVWAGRLTYGSLFALGATMAVASFVPYPVERLAEMHASEPGRVRAATPKLPPRVSFAPVRGGGQLQVGWSF